MSNSSLHCVHFLCKVFFKCRKGSDFTFKSLEMVLRYQKTLPWNGQYSLLINIGSKQLELLQNSIANKAGPQQILPNNSSCSAYMQNKLVLGYITKSRLWRIQSTDKTNHIFRLGILNCDEQLWNDLLCLVITFSCKTFVTDMIHNLNWFLWNTGH